MEEPTHGRRRRGQTAIDPTQSKDTCRDQNDRCILRGEDRRRGRRLSQAELQERSRKGLVSSAERSGGQIPLADMSFDELPLEAMLFLDDGKGEEEIESVRIKH